jgi:hypothetical protein
MRDGRYMEDIVFGGGTIWGDHRYGGRIKN